MPEPEGMAVPGKPLVVDADILARMVIAEYLRDCGYKVIEGVNADDTLAVLQAGKKIDVILAEVQLAEVLTVSSLPGRFVKTIPRSM